MEANNMAAMREALVSAIGTLKKLYAPSKRTAGQIVTCRQKCEAALSAPPRNCDVGTVDEQTKRKMEFCRKQGGCGNCPFNRGPSITPCVLAWAQMPYEEGGAK